MINVHQERVLPIAEVPQQIRLMTGTRAPHPRTVDRWVRTGVAGCRLEIVRIGKRRYTSVEALGRWLAAVTESCEVGKGE